MKTAPALNAADLLARIAKVAPSICIQAFWEIDPTMTDIRKECDGMDNEDPDDWQAWQAEVRASCVVNGRLLSGSDYLGGTWEKAGDNPEKSNPEISGYFAGMIDSALLELAKQLPETHPVRNEIEAAMVVT